MVIAIELVQGMDASAAVFAFVAAVFWFRSAAGTMPSPGTYWDGKAPPDDPFVKAFQRSMVMNRWGAIFAGLSAIAAGAGFTLRTINA